jgi:hypothetical protein
MNITSVDDVIGAPGAARITYEDGTSQTMPRNRLPPELQLQNAGAMAQNMSMPEPQAPMVSTGPANPGEFSAKWESPQVQDVQPQMTQGQKVQYLQQMAAPIPIATPARYVAPPTPAPMSPRDAEIARLESPYRRVAGTAAFDPKVEAARRSAVPVSQTVQTSSARAYDPAAVVDWQEKERKALELKSEADMLQASSEVQAKELMHTEVSNLYRQQQAEVQRAEQDFAEKQQGLESEAKAIASREVDPNRAFKNMSVFQILGLSIAAGLKGYATQGRDNSIMDSLMHRMDADIRAQEFDIQNAKGRTENALFRMSQQFGSLQAGKAALKDLQMSVMKSEIASKTAGVGTAIAKANGDAMMARIDAEQGKLREQRWSEAQGQATVQTSVAMMSPRAAKSGGLVLKGDSERLKGFESADKLRENQASTEGKQLANLEKRNEIISGKPTNATQQKAQQYDQDNVTKYGKERAELLDTINTSRKFIELNGIKKDENGNWVKTNGIAGVGFGTSVYPEAWDSHEGQTNLQDLRQVGAMGAKSIYGILTSAEKASFQEDFLPVNNEDRLVKGVGSIVDKAEAKLKDLDAAYGPKVTKEFEQRRATMGAEKTKTHAAISEPE